MLRNCSLQHTGKLSDGLKDFRQKLIIAVTNIFETVNLKCRRLTCRVLGGQKLSSHFIEVDKGEVSIVLVDLVSASPI